MSLWYATGVDIARAHDGKDHVAEDERAALLAENYQPFETYAGAIAGAYGPGDYHIYGQWGPLINWPHVPVSASNLPDGRILTWSSNEIDGFPRGPEYTHATIWNPVDNSFNNIPHGNHDMFCAHNVMLEDGRIFINGGRHTPFTTLFDPKTETWTRLQNMARGRWYPTTMALPNGRVFTGLGGSGGQFAEMWQDGVGWKRLTGIDFTDSVLDYSDRGSDPENPHYEHNWWPYFALTQSGKIFHYGPTPKMQLLDVDGQGSMQSLGKFTSQWYPKHGASIMYRQGKILLAGGAASGTDLTSTNRTMLLDVTTSTPTVDTSIQRMRYTRKFHNAVVLPNGEVLMIGGNQNGKKFNDENSRLEGEIWNPSTKKFRPMAAMSAPRNYHSVGLLLTDGRVLSGGGGLNGPGHPSNHQNIQIFTPPYLYEPDGSLSTRPQIFQAPRAVNHGSTMTVQATPGISQFSFVRMSATTHAMNTDVRRIQANFTQTSSGWYDVNVHPNANVLVPGYYMLFALDGDGTPSVSHVVQVNAGGSVENYIPELTVPSDVLLRRGIQETINVTVRDIDSDRDNFSFSANGLPPGMSINRMSGRVFGTPTLNGNYAVTITVNDGDGGQDSVSGLWVVADKDDVNANPNQGFKYDYYEGSWTKLPNFGTLTPKRSGRTKDFDIVDLSDVHDGFGFSFHGHILITESGDYTFYVRSNDGSKLWIDDRLEISNDGVHGSEEKNKTINLIAGYHAFKLNYFDYKDGHILAVNWKGPGFNKTAIPPGVKYQTLPETSSNSAPVLSRPGNLVTDVNTTVDVKLSATDSDNDALTFSATGLPTGLSISRTGRITGKPENIGNKTVRVIVRDTKNASDSESFTWRIEKPTAPPLTVNAIQASPKPVDTRVNYTATVRGGSDPEVSWDFGDGSAPTRPSTNNSVSHTFREPGRYIVVVQVSSATGEQKQIQFVQAIHRSRAARAPQMSSSIALEIRNGKSNRIWNVNPDNDTVSIHDASSNTRIQEIRVGDEPRSVAIAPNGRVWVTNGLSGTISVIDSENLRIVKSLKLPYGSQPHGVVFDPENNFAWVVLTGRGKLAKLNISNGVIRDVKTIGGSLKHISIDRNRSRLYLPRYITRPLPNESGKTPMTARNGQRLGGEVVIVDASNFKTVKEVVLRHSERIDSENGSRGIPNYLGAATISPDGLSAWIPSKQDNILRGQFRDGEKLTHDSTVRAITSRINLQTQTEVYGTRIDHDDAGTPTAAAYGPNGNYLYVTLEGSRNIVMIDAYQRTEVARFDVGRAPQGVVVSPNGEFVYVHNFLDRSVTKLNVKNVLFSNSPEAERVATIDAVENEALGPKILKGKKFFYDSRDDRLASQDYMSCASCHSNGGHDGRVWDRSDVGEGVRNTIDLRGHAGTAHGPLHWTGNFDEVHDFEGQIRSLSGGRGLMSDRLFNEGSRSDPLGDGKSNKSDDLDALAIYVASLSKYPPSPFRRSDGKFTRNGTVGKKLFVSEGCASCHAGEHMTDSALNVRHNIGTVSGRRSGDRLGEEIKGIDTPTLRGAWDTAPYLHDGSAPTIEAAILAHNNVDVSNSQLVKLASYIRQLEGPEADGRDTDPEAAQNPGEVGRVTVSQSGKDRWHTVNLKRTYTKPVVIMSPVSYQDAAPVTIRLRNIGTRSFQFQLDEWDYMDGQHGRETLGYLVVESGVHRLSSGDRIMAGVARNITADWNLVDYPARFKTRPVVFTNVTSINGDSAVISRVRNVQHSRFRLHLREEEGNDGYHSPETVHWVAIEQATRRGKRQVGKLNGVDQGWKKMSFGQRFAKTPIVFGETQYERSQDAAVLRFRKLNRSGLEVRIQEEKSADAETDHPREKIGYAIFPGPGLLK